MKQEYDVFISHASEDKDVARPLADILDRLGVRLWYDEYSLEIGDSLSRSIDGGLAASRFGVVILSPSFFKKPWATRELSGLVAKETAAAQTGKVILPIWHGVDVDSLRETSPTLADRFALSTQTDSVELIALKVLRVARPDVFEHLQRWVLWHEKVRQAKPVLMKMSELKQGERRHDTLSPSLLVRARLLHRSLREMVTMSFDEMVDVFCRDLHPDREIEIWERIAAAYGEVNERMALSLEQRREVFSTLLGLSIGQGGSIQRVLAVETELEAAILQSWLRVAPIPAPPDSTKTQRHA